MNCESHEIRVFLSSTFKDMQAERDYLLRHVFPEVRERCAERGATFTEIDLRWGVTEDEARSGATVAICLSEIDRCRGFPPFFIGFLGERYGWVPVLEDLQEHLGRDAFSVYHSEIEGALKNGISVTELEMLYALKGQQASKAETLFYLRNPELTKTLCEQRPRGMLRSDFYDDDVGATKLAALKQRLRESPRLAIDNYDSLEAFGESIKAHLLAELDLRLPEKEDTRETLRRPHANFALSRLTAYVPIESSLSAVEGYVRRRLANQEAGICWISGESGLGKSSLMSHLARQHLPECFPAAQIVDWYVGADGKHSVEEWVDGLLRLLAEPPSSGALAVDTSKGRWEILSDLLATRMSEREGKPLILMLDALDQLSSKERALERLQNLKLPNGVALIVSSTPDLAFNPDRVSVHALTRPTAEQIEDIIGGYSDRYRKAEIRTELAHLLLASNAVTLPLFLTLTLEYLRVRATHESVGDDLKRLLKNSTVEGLFKQTIIAWNHDYADLTHPELASRAVALIAASRAGLTEEELGTLLAAPDDPLDVYTNAPRLPRERLSRLLAAIRPYLLRYDGREVLMHGALRRASLAEMPADKLREQLLTVISGESGRAVTERVYQCSQLALSGKDVRKHLESLEQLLAKPENVVHCYQVDAGLLDQSLRQLHEMEASSQEGGGRLLEAWASSSFAGVAPTFGLHVLEWLRTQSFLSEAKCWGRNLLRMIRVESSESYERMLALAVVGAVHVELAEIDAATEYLKESLGILDACYPQDRYRFVLLNSLAGCDMRNGDFQAAQTKFEDSASLLRRGGSADLLAATLNNLGNCLRQQRLFDRAINILEEAVDVERGYAPAGSPMLATMLNNLGDVLRELNQLPEAALRLEESSEIESRTLPRSHPSRARTFVNLGHVYYEQGRLEEALNVFRQASEIYRASEVLDEVGMEQALLYQAGIKEILGGDAQELAEAWESLGRFKLSAHKPDAKAADQFLTKALNLRLGQLSGLGSPEASRTMYALGVARWYQGRIDDVGTDSETVGAEQIINHAMGTYPKRDSQHGEFIRECQATLTQILVNRSRQLEADGELPFAVDALRQAEAFAAALSGDTRKDEFDEDLA